MCCELATMFDIKLQSSCINHNLKIQNFVTKCLGLTVKSKEVFLTLISRHYLQQVSVKPIWVAARIKAWVCSRSLAGFAGLNPTENIYTSLL